MEEFPRIKRLPPYVFNVTGELKLAARRRGEDVIDFSMGNPDQPTPRHIVEKLIETVQRPDTHGYSVSKGIPRLRRAICNWYQDALRRRARSRLRSDRHHRLEGRHRASRARDARSRRHRARAEPELSDPYLRPGDRGRRHPSRADACRAWISSRRSSTAIRDTYPKPKMLIVNFPSNPTTQCVDLAFFERLVAIAREHHIYVVHDLAYADIVFDGYKAPSIMQVPGARDIAVEFFTMSKSYNMAGWRVGFMVGNRELVTALAPHEELSRLRHVHADPGRLHRRARRPAGLCGNRAQGVPEAARRACVRDCRRSGGKWTCRKRRCTSGRRYPSRIERWARSSSRRSCWPKRKIAVAPGIGFGHYGDDHVRFALIENEARTRQAVRGIRDMFSKDGLL